MPHATELDLSWNDMRTGAGLEAIGFAISTGALHSLQRLNLVNCTAIKTLPESIGELLELQSIYLDGCVQLAKLPKSMSKLASLKVLHIVNCHILMDEELAHLPSSCQVMLSGRLVPVCVLRVTYNSLKRTYNCAGRPCR